MRLQILDNRVDPVRRRDRQVGLLDRLELFHSQLGSDELRNRDQLRRRDREPVIGDRPGRRNGRLGQVQPIHRLLAGRQVAARHELPRERHRAVHPAEEVAAERQNDISPIEVRDDRHCTTESFLLRLEGAVRVAGLVLMPLRARILSQQFLDLASQGGRIDGFRQNPEASPLQTGLPPKGVPQVGEEVLPRADFFDPLDPLRAIGIVQRQDRRLGNGVRCAKARGVRRVAFNLRRAAFVTLNEQPDRPAAF